MEVLTDARKYHIVVVFFTRHTFHGEKAMPKRLLVQRVSDPRDGNICRAVTITVFDLKGTQEVPEHFAVVSCRQDGRSIINVHAKIIKDAERMQALRNFNNSTYFSGLPEAGGSFEARQFAGHELEAFRAYVQDTLGYVFRLPGEGRRTTAD